MEASILGCNPPSSAFNGHNLLFFSLLAPPPVGLKLSRGEAGLMSSAALIGLFSTVQMTCAC